jgi:hypothetical protein
MFDPTPSYLFSTIFSNKNNQIRYIINIPSEKVRVLNGKSIIRDIIISLRYTGWLLRRIFHQTDNFAPEKANAISIADRHLFMKLSRKK